MRRAAVPRSILLPLTFALACASPSSSSPEHAQGAAPAGAPEADADAEVAPEAAAAEPETASRRDRPKKAVEDAKPAADPPPAPEPEPGDADRSQSRLDIAVPSINGGLNRDIIRRIASDGAQDIRECHGRALASISELAGKLVVELELDADGNVTAAKIGEDSRLRHRDVESCVLAVIEGWSFAEAGGKGSVSLAFEF